MQMLRHLAHFDACSCSQMGRRAFLRLALSFETQPLVVAANTESTSLLVFSQGLKLAYKFGFILPWLLVTVVYPTQGRLVAGASCEAVRHRLF